MPEPLIGKQIVVTRPATQAQGFTQLVQQAGGQVLAFPVLAIEAASDLVPARRVLAQVADYDVVLFISTNAVAFGLALLDEVQTQALRQGCTIGAIGKKTAQALQHHHIPVCLVPDNGYTSEDLLALPVLQDLTSRRVLIVRGKGGRETLATTLNQRGAVVDYANVYQRVCPPVNPSVLKQHHDQQQLDIIAVTSGEGLQNLLVILENPDWIKNVPLLVGSRRLAMVAKQGGFTGEIVIAENPSDEAMFHALVQWVSGNQQA